MQLLDAFSKTRRARFYEPRKAASAAGRHLRAIQDRTQTIRRHDIIAVATADAGTVILPHFLEHHRKLGIGHFLFIDAGLDPAAVEGLRAETDCSIWSLPRGPDRLARRNAANFLLRQYGSGHWCLTLAADSLLMFPYAETRRLSDLAEFLGSEGRETLFALELDMYGRLAPAETEYRPETTPLDVAPYFDATGYVQRAEASYGDTRVLGGPRRRIAHRNDPEAAPPLNTVPLVKWRADYHYLDGTHLLAPKRLNRPHCKWHLSPTGCLLRFRSLAAAIAPDALADHGDYSKDLMSRSLMFDESVMFEHTGQLVALGLMSSGQWF